jgi:hypothetical protein
MPLDVAAANAGLALDALPLDTLRALALDALLPLGALALDPLRALALDALLALGALPLDPLGPDALDVPRAPLDNPLLALRPLETNALLALRTRDPHPLLTLRALHANALLALGPLHADSLDALLALRPSLLALGLGRLGLLSALLFVAAWLRLGGGGDCKRRDGRDQKGFGHRRYLACLDSGHFGETRLITI